MRKFLYVRLFDLESRGELKLTSLQRDIRSLIAVKWPCWEERRSHHFLTLVSKTLIREKLTDSFFFWLAQAK